MKHRINLKVKQRTPAEKFFQGVLDRTTGIIQNPDSIFYYEPDTKQINFELDNVVGTFWVRQHGIWSVFVRDFNMDFTTIRALIMGAADQHYDLGTAMSNCGWKRSIVVVESHYYLGSVIY